MFPDVNELLDINERQLPSGKCLFLCESRTDGGVFLHHMVSLYLKNKLNVCLVAFANSFGHYNNIGNKLGNNLNNAKDNGNLIFIDAMKMLYEALSDNDTADAHPGTFLNHVDCPNAGLKQLFLTIKDQLGTLSDTSKQTLIVIEDTSIPLNLGLAPQAVMIFVMYLRQVTLQGNHCLLLLQRCDEDADDEDGQLLKRQTSHLSDVIIRVSGLKSGYSKDVHGEVKVIQRDLQQSEPRDSNVREMQYKLSDKSIQLFAKGTSAAVL